MFAEIKRFTEFPQDRVLLCSEHSVRERGRAKTDEVCQGKLCLGFV